MTTRRLKARLKLLDRYIAEYRSILKIDDKWTIKVIYDPNDKDAYASQDQSCAEYWKIDITFCSKLMDIEDKDEFEAMAKRTALHELLHLLMWQYTSFAQNVAGNRMQGELYKLEEQIVQQLEDVIYDM